MSEDYYPGKDCTCAAHSETYCNCGADWTDPEVYELREENKRLKERVKQLERSLNDHKQMFTKPRPMEMDRAKQFNGD